MPNPDNSKGLNTDSIFKGTSAGKVTENNGWTASGGEQLCDPVSMPVEKTKENRTPKVSSYTIRLDGFDEEIVRANVFKNYTAGSVCYFLHCAKYPNNLYEKLITLIEKNYHIKLFSFPLHEDYWDYWDPNAEASMYKCNFKLNDCELELCEVCEDDSVFLEKEDGSDDGATDKLVTHLLQELMVDAADIAKQTTQESSEEKAITNQTPVHISNCADKPLPPNIRGQFDGMLIKVLKEEYQEFGFEKNLQKNCILLRGTKNYYFQIIEKRVVAEGNGRPITYYSEYVFALNTNDVSNISMDNVWQFCKNEPILENNTAEYGVLF